MANAAWTSAPLASWKTTYRGIFPDALLDGLSVESRESGWRDLLAGSGITPVGCDVAGKLGCDGELYTIYLRQETQRKGLGALLVRRLAHELNTRDFRSMAVWF
jgi:GNAT superfamily N-acetyltransferase